MSSTPVGPGGGSEPSTSSRAKGALKRLVARALRPGVQPVSVRLDRIESHLGMLTADARKYHGELEYWRWLIKRGGSQKDFGEPFEVVFARWQRQRLLKLGEYLGLPLHEEGGVAGIDRWAQSRSVVEIGAGPYPSVAAAKLGWRRCVAVDPLARGYVEEGLLPPACEGVVYIEAPGETIPLPGNFADLVIIENCLDHVSSPPAVVGEILRLLKPGGLVWLFVDFSDHTDALHPHALNETKMRALLRDFQVVGEELSPNKAHPKAYGAYRGLWRKPGEGSPRLWTEQAERIPVGPPPRAEAEMEAKPAAIGASNGVLHT